MLPDLVRVSAANWSASGSRGPPPLPNRRWPVRPDTQTPPLAEEDVEVCPPVAFDAGLSTDPPLAEEGVAVCCPPLAFDAGSSTDLPQAKGSAAKAVSSHSTLRIMLGYSMMESGCWFNQGGQRRVISPADWRFGIRRKVRGPGKAKLRLTATCDRACRPENRAVETVAA